APRRTSPPTPRCGPPTSGATSSSDHARGRRSGGTGGMTFIVLLVLGLVVLAGIIAFAGDRLGTYVGRRRLSLFGARPRRTGQIVGVMAGILIMLTTLGVLALAFENATQTLLNFQRTLDELNRLRVQERVLNQNVADANAQLAELRAALEEA